MKSQTKIGKLSSELKEGKAFTIAQIRKKFRLKNPRAAISTLRNKMDIGKSYANNTMYYHL